MVKLRRMFLVYARLFLAKSFHVKMVAEDKKDVTQPRRERSHAALDLLPYLEE